MIPDAVFILIGALCVAACFVFARHWRQHGRIALFGALFGVGLLMQGTAPHLNFVGKYVDIPAAVVAQPGFNQEAYLAHARWMQILSTLLVAGGALGLASCYRRVLTGPTRIQNTRTIPEEEGLCENGPRGVS